MNYTVDSQPACNFPQSLHENLRLRDWSPSPADPTRTCPSASTPHCPAAGLSSLTWTSVVVASLALQLRMGPYGSVFSIAARMISVILHIVVQSLRHADFLNPMPCSMPGFPVLHYLPDFVWITSIVSMMPPNHLILCRPLLLLPSLFPSIRVISNELALCIRWSKYWRFSVSPSNEYSVLIV